MENLVSEKIKKLLPDYEYPPLTEVVCGTQFKPLHSFLAAHVGRLWSRFEKEFPNVQEVSPISPIIERFEEFTEPFEMGIKITDKPPLPRTWFINQTGSLLIQTQQDRFLLNWRKMRPDDEYPRYEKVIASFWKHIKTFEDFVEEGDFGPLEFNQYELSYINLISEPENGGMSPHEVGSAFRDIKWDLGTRDLPHPESINATYSFAFPEERIRLHSKIRTAIRAKEKTPVIRLEITARGMPDNKSQDERMLWFDKAHERIVCAFADLTQVDIQKNYWKRKI